MQLCTTEFILLISMQSTLECSNLGNKSGYLHVYASIIGSNCPGISGTVPDFKHLSRVPEGSATCLLLVPDEGQTLA